MNEQQESQMKPFKTHIILPILFIITLTVAIVFLAVKDFIVDLNQLVIWLFFAVSLIYIGVAITDLFINKQRGKKQKIFIIVMCALCFVASMLYMIFYLIAKGR